MKKGAELNTEQSSFGKQGSVEFYEGKESGQKFGTTCYDGFTEQRATLCASDIEHVAQLRYVAECEVGGFCSKPVSQSCAVQIEWDLEFVTDIPQFRKFVAGIEGAEFGGVGYIQHSRTYHME